MPLSLINQFLGHETTGARLSELLDRFSEQPNAQFRTLVAFVSRAGLELIEAALRRFLDRGCATFWIVGVDLGGTGQEALRFLHDLSRRYPHQVDARVLSTGDNRHVFHPKIFWLDSDQERVVVIGSANATAGGLAENFEVSTEFVIPSGENGEGDELNEQLDYLWMSYSSPLPPLQDEHLIPVNGRLIAILGSDQPHDSRPHMPHPLRALVPRIVRPRAGTPRVGRTRSEGRSRIATADRDLVMDILAETRQTQVQIPVETFGRFFDGRRKRIELRQLRAGVVVKTDERPLIHLPNKTHRIEVDAIRGLPRPQIIRLSRRNDSPGVVDYEIVLKGTKAYTELDKLLRERGERTRRGARRWLIRSTDRK